MSYLSIKSIRLITQGPIFQLARSMVIAIKGY